MSAIQWKMKKVLLAFLAFVMIASPGAAAILMNSGRSYAATGSLLYRLEFADEENMFANTAGTEYADATAPEGNSFSLTSVGGRTGLNFVGETSFVNYLSLPTDMFAEKTAITVAGWFYVPEDIASYACEMTIHSQTESAILRADPYAEYHGGGYLFIAGDKKGVESGAGLGVKAMRNGWYHMAYVLDSEAHTFTVYQNGAVAYEATLEEGFSVSEFAAEDATFWLGQNGEENNHPDYKGVMSDIRVYGEALNAETLKAEYGFTLDDFKAADYTFDNPEDPLADSIRGYDLSTYRGENVVYEDGTAKLTGGTGLQAFDVEQNKNIKFSEGLTKLTISMDLNIQSPTSTDWKRIVDLYSNSSRLTFMAYCPRDNGKLFEVAYNDSGEDYQMLLDVYETELPNNTWFNLTFTIAKDTLKIYIDGELFATCQPKDNQIDFSDFLYRWSWDNKGNLTFGTNTYEQGNNLDVTYDRIQIWASEATAEEVAEIAKEGTRYSIAYDANGGKGDRVSDSYKNGEEVKIAENTFTNDGYIFTGWNTQADGRGTAYAVGDTLTITANMILYAQWEVNASFITFDANGGRGEMKAQAVSYGETAKIEECGFFKSGYNFAGWNTAADGSGTAYAAGADISLSEDITLYAQWTAKEYTITFDANGGEGTMQALSMVFDSEKALTANTFTREGYSFAGWALTSEGIAVYKDGESVSAIGEGNDVTLYAVWLREEYAISFNANGGTGSMGDIEAQALAFVTLPANAFTKTDCEFLGWATSADGEVVYQDGAKVIFEGDTTLYAVWSDADEGDGGNTDGGFGDGDTGDNTDDGSGDETEGGCSSAVFGGAALLCGAAVAGAVTLIAKRRKNS